MDLGYTEEEADKTILFQQLLLPGAGAIGAADKTSKAAQKLISKWSKEAKEAKRIAAREARKEKRIIPEKPPIHLGGRTMSPEKKRAIEIFIEKFKTAEGRTPTVAEVKAVFGMK